MQLEKRLDQDGKEYIVQVETREVVQTVDKKLLLEQREHLLKDLAKTEAVLAEIEKLEKTLKET